MIHDARDLAVVASSIPGYRSFMAERKGGCTVPPGDAGLLSDVVISLLRDAPLRKAMGVRGRATAALYDWERVAPQILAYYEALRPARPPGPLG